MNERWTIEQLTPLVEKALDKSGYNGQHSRRVRRLPDLRTIRYYTTLGLLDPPAEMRGRKAYYGRRHLVQLVAIKRLQAQRLSLAAVQQRLAGIGDSALEELAALPADFWPCAAAATADPIATATGREEKPEMAERNAFWAAAPALSAYELAGKAAARLALHLPVVEGVQLVFDSIDPAFLPPDFVARLKGPLEALAQTLRELHGTKNLSD